MKKRLTLIASKKLKKKGAAAMALLMALTILSSLTAAAADSGYFDSVFEGDTSYLADFIQTPKQSVSDENYIFTLEQYLVTDNAALVIYSIEAKTEDAAAELNAVDERGYSTFFDMDTISFVPTDFEKVRFGGFCDGSLADGRYDTETKKYYMVDCVDFSNPRILILPRASTK